MVADPACEPNHRRRRISGVRSTEAARREDDEQGRDRGNY